MRAFLCLILVILRLNICDQPGSRIFFGHQRLAIEFKWEIGLFLPLMYDRYRYYRDTVHGDIVVLLFYKPSARQDLG